MAKQTKQTAPGLPVLKADLKSGSFHRLYFFFGEERYLQEYYLETLRKRLVSGAMEEFNYRRLSGGNLSEDGLQNAVDALPMMAEHTLVRVDDFDPFAQNEETRNWFIRLISDLPDTCCLVMNYDTVPFRRDGKMKKLSAAIEEYGCVVEFPKQTPRELCDWIARHFRREGKSIAPDVCQYLLFVTDGTMTALHSEIGKLAAYCRGEQVTRQDVDAVVEPALTAVAFDITDALARKDYDAALGKLRDVLRAGEEPIPVLAVIGSHFRRILAARAVLAAGKGGDALMPIIGTNSDYYARKIMDQAGKMTDEACRRAVLACYETDKKLKSGADGGELLELLILTLAVEERV